MRGSALPRGRRRARTAGLLALAALVAVVGAGCVRVPASGPIRSTGTVSGALPADGVPAIDPEPPTPGAGPGEIVRGFLDAMQASPVSTTVARQYLTPDARGSWQPERSTIVYADRSEPVGTTQVEVRLTDADRYDAVGAWRGRVRGEASVLRFRVVYVDGEFRIADPPDALVVVRSWFEPRFTPADLYFFDPSGRAFVPEPVVAPVGESRASTLVRALLRGPAPGLSSVEQTFIPAGLDLALSVPVDAQGLARVALTGEVPPMSEEQTALMVAQLAWTMRQDPRVLTVQVVLNGSPVRMAGGADRVEVGTGSSFDVGSADAGGVLYGLLDGRLAAGPVDSLELLDGPLSRPGRGLRSVAVDLDGAAAAAVTGDGSRLLTGPTRSGTLTPVAARIVGARDLLPPAWTAAGRIWAVDRAGGRAIVSTGDGEDAEPLRPVEVPGLTGQDVRRILVSRDGSRLIAIVGAGERARLVVSRVATTADDRILRVLPATILPTRDDPGRLLDVAWYGDNALAVMRRVGEGLARVDTIGIDGSPTGAGGLSTTVTGGRSLVGSPDPAEALYAVTTSELVDLSRAGRGTRVARDGVRAPTYVG